MLIILLQIAALIIFILLVWPHIKKENWKAKFIDDKHARSVLIVFALILVFVVGISTLFDVLFPVEELK